MVVSIGDVDSDSGSTVRKGDRRLRFTVSHGDRGGQEAVEGEERRRSK